MSSRLSHLAYEHLQSQLLTNRLPAGAKVSELAIARQLGISRTPVREAIRQLQAEGLLYQIPSSGTYVAEPDQKEIIDAHETRLALELYLLRRAVDRLGDSERARLRRLVRAIRELAHDLRTRQQPFLTGVPLAELIQLERDFHATLLAPTDNELADRVIQEVDVRLRIFLHRGNRMTLADVAQTLLSYHHLAAAACRGDCEGSVAALEAYRCRQLRSAFACLRAGPPRTAQLA
ncbi:MAG: GntR family transcriptional regulator [Pirellulales bacterium]